MTGIRPRLSLPGQKQGEEERKRVGAVVAGARRPDVVRDVVQELFPAIAGRLGGTNYSDSFQGTWRRERRVAHRDGFTAYLERGVPSGSLAAQDVRDALQALDDREKLERLLQTTGEERLMNVLARLEDYEGSFDLQHPEVAVEVLASASARFRPRERRFFQFTLDIAVRRLLLRVLRGRTESGVEAILDKVTPPDLSSRVELVRLVGHREGSGSRLVNESAAKRLEQDLVGDVLASEPAVLRDEPGLGTLLWLAEEVEPARTRARLTELIDDPILLMRWLSQTMFEKSGSNGHLFLVPWKQLVSRVDPIKLIERVRALDDDLVTSHADDRISEAVRQAKLYAENPADAARDFDVFTGVEFPEVGYQSR